MKLKLHHVNVCSKDVPALEAFYRDVMDLAPEPSLEAGRIIDSRGYPGAVAFLSDGTTQFHLAEKDYGICFPHGPGHQSGRARPHRLPHRRYRSFQETVEGKGHPVFRLWCLGHEGLGADLLPRSRRQRHRGPPGAGVSPAPAPCSGQQGRHFRRRSILRSIGQANGDVWCRYDRAHSPCVRESTDSPANRIFERFRVAGLTARSANSIFPIFNKATRLGKSAIFQKESRRGNKPRQRIFARGSTECAAIIRQPRV